MNNKYCTKTQRDYTGVCRQERHTQGTWKNPAVLLSEERPRLQYWARFEATCFKNSPDQVERAQETPAKHRPQKIVKRYERDLKMQNQHVSLNLKITWGKRKRKAVVQCREQQSLGKQDNKPQICKRFLQRGKECCRLLSVSVGRGHDVMGLNWSKRF